MLHVSSGRWARDDCVFPIALRLNLRDAFKQSPAQTTTAPRCRSRPRTPPAAREDQPRRESLAGTRARPQSAPATPPPPQAQPPAPIHANPVVEEPSLGRTEAARIPPPPPRRERPRAPVAYQGALAHQPSRRKTALTNRLQARNGSIMRRADTDWVRRRQGTIHPVSKNLARATILFAVLLTAVLLAPGRASAATPCWKQIVNDWSVDGSIDKTYTVSCYRDALRTYRRTCATTRASATTSRAHSRPPPPRAHPRVNQRAREAGRSRAATSARSAPVTPSRSPLLVLTGLASLLLAGGAAGVLSRLGQARPRSLAGYLPSISSVRSASRAARDRARNSLRYSPGARMASKRRRAARFPVARS